MKCGTVRSTLLIALSLLYAPLAAEAPRKAMPVIGYLHVGSPSYAPTSVGFGPIPAFVLFRQGLRGYPETFSSPLHRDQAASWR